MSTTTDPTTADILNAAADYIEAHGLHRGAIRGPNGSVCTVGAICDAAKALHAVRGAVPALDEMAALVGIGYEDDVARWSDLQALDAADVANHLRKAAERSAEAVA